MKTIVIILAGGSGERYGGLKQFTLIHGKPVLVHTVERFHGFSKIIVIPGDEIETAVDIAYKFKMNDFIFVPGGETRQESVKNALMKAQAFQPENVIITDANRPLVTRKTIDKGLELLESDDETDCVVTACIAVNTMCTLGPNAKYNVHPRKDMYALLMPQFFNFKRLLKAHLRTTKSDVTDDSQLVKDKNTIISIVPFWEGLKLTYPEDYKIFELLLEKENGQT
jgi:2-C-methyl-D-erythritol 4-phosphate cytidylyltransferase